MYNKQNLCGFAKDVMNINVNKINVVHQKKKKEERNKMSF